MLVKDARLIAKQWLSENKSRIPGYCGAIFAGSTNYLSPSAPWPAGSDLDIYIYQINPVDRIPQKKVDYKGVVLEPSYHNFQDIQDPYRVLAMPYIAPQFSRRLILEDPYKLLAPVYQAVGEHYKDRKWTRTRLRAVYEKAQWNFNTVAGATPETPVFHILLRFMGGFHNIAVLPCIPTYGNPTLRKALVTSALILKKHRASDLQEELLGIVGSQDLSAKAIRDILRQCRPMLARALEVHNTPFWGDQEMTPGAMKKMLQGTAEMIDSGHHREAIHYILYIHHCGQSAIQRDGTEEDKARYFPLFLDLISLLGIGDLAACQSRAAASQKTLNRFYRFSQTLLTA